MLLEHELNQDPIIQFQIWFKEAESCLSIRYPDAFCLSTIGLDGHPDSRIVLLKEVSELGFVFFTNSQSTKGKSLIVNPNVALNFYWDALRRQVRVLGVATAVSSEYSDRYFKKRPRLAQLGAWASLQSEQLSSREELETKVREWESKFDGMDVPRPPHWFGWCVKPQQIEFWQEGMGRLHDRFIYQLLSDKKWGISRRYP